MEINKRLQEGWNPFLEQNGTKELTKVADAAAIYLRNIGVEYKDKNLSLDTLRTYTSRIKIFLKYLDNNDLGQMFCYKLDRQLILKYLDWLRYEKKVSARTRDNHFTCIRTMCFWMMTKKYLTANPCEGIKKLNKNQKNRIVIPPVDREKIFAYFKQNNINYLVFCMTCYYCLVRRTELSKVKVGDLDLKNGTLFISAEDAKNNKSAHVTVPDILGSMLAEHIKKAKVTDYLFSNENYAPGPVRFLPNKSTSTWSSMRRKLGLDSRIKWYSLKDSGITDLITAGVPLIAVRDQARHHSIKQTDEYTPRSFKKANAEVQHSGVDFLKK